MTYLELAQQSLDKVTEKHRKNKLASGDEPSTAQLLEIARTAALIDIASSLFELQLIAQRKDGDR